MHIKGLSISGECACLGAKHLVLISQYYIKKKTYIFIILFKFYMVSVIVKDLSKDRNYVDHISISIVNFCHHPSSEPGSPISTMRAGQTETP